MNADSAPGGRQPSDQTSRLGLWVHGKGSYRPHPPSPFIITKPESWHSRSCILEVTVLYSVEFHGKFSVKIIPWKSFHGRFSMKFRVDKNMKTPYHGIPRGILHGGACGGQAHSPAAAGEQCGMHSGVGTLQWAFTCPLKNQKWSFPWGSRCYSLGSHESIPKRHLDRFSRFCTGSRVHPCGQHKDRPRYLRHL